MLPHLRIALVACVAFAPCSAQSPIPAGQAPVPNLRPDEIPILRTNSDLVVVDVVVRDKAGHPVEGLPQSDFRVFEDKREQTIASFEEHGDSRAQQAGTPPPLPSSVYTNLPQYSNAAANVILLDALNTRNLDLAYARTQMVKFLHTIPQGTPIALFVLGRHLRLIRGFTTDIAALQRVLTVQKTPSVVQADSSSQPGSSPQFAQNDAGDAAAAADFEAALKVQDTMIASVRVEETLAAFEELGHYLGAISGRKSLIWFSAAFPVSIGDPSALNDLRNFTAEIQKTNDLLARARVAVYPVDARGVMTLPATQGTTPSMRAVVSEGVHNDVDVPMGWWDQHRTMIEIAEDTGGKAFYDINAVGESAAQVITDGSKYYTLAYVPADSRRDQRFRKIEVRLKEEHYDLAYRRGYFGVGGSNSHPPENLSAMTAAMFHGGPRLSEVTFEVQVLPMPGKPNQDELKQQPVKRYRLEYSVDPHRLQLSVLPDGRRQVQIEVAQAIFSLDGHRLNSSDVGLNSDLTPAQMTRAMQQGIRVHQEIDAPVDSQFLRMGIRDASSGKIGSLEIALPR